MPSGGTTAASSLYSGIFNEGDEASTSEKAQETSHSIEQPSSTEGLTDSKGPEETSGATTKPQAWSAALRFAPRKNVNPQANKARRPPASTLLSSAFTPASASHEAEQVPGPSKSVIEPTPKASNVPETSTSNTWNRIRRGEEGPNKQEVQIDALLTSTNVKDPKSNLPSVLAPPELSISAEELEKDNALFAALAEKRGEKRQGQQQKDDEWQEDGEEDDVNGFANTKEGKKARRKKQKRKRNGSPGHPGGISASLRMDAEYDVRIPNDYNEFKDLRRKRREAIRLLHKEREVEEALRRDGGYPGQDEEDYESESEEEQDYHRRNKMGRFAPPASYSQGITNSHFRPTASTEWDDDDEKPYLSPPPSLPPPAPDRETYVHVTNSNPSLAMSGEEAYQRRLALSQANGQVNPSVLGEESRADDTAKGQAPPDLASRAAAAAAIAARLAKAAPPPPPPPPTMPQSSQVTKISAPASASSTSQEQDAGSFAERLMAKQGWKKGEALGAEGNKGMLNPILAEKVEAERQRRRHGSQNEKTLHSNRGTIVNAREEERRREEREKFGIPSEVVLLENMVDLTEIDEDLSDEIGEECAKHGYVQQVFIWPKGPDGVRIFVKFTGMAGAWRCVKELEGRFFGGKTVRARYYPLEDFEGGNYMHLYDH